ncbi:MAG: hypothetical protein R3E32_29890 [Chitinophagales bacterium]
MKTNVLAQGNIYSFRARLYEDIANPSMRCGCDANITGYKFEVLGSDSTQLIGKYIVALEMCPEFRGEDFFEKGKIYAITAKVYNRLHYPVIRNDYERENLRLFKNEEIVKIDSDK